MTFRESINNLIRSDRAESPTDFIFIVWALALIAMQTYALQTGKAVPYFGEALVALGSYKTVKVGSSYVKGRAKDASATDPANPLG